MGAVFFAGSSAIDQLVEIIKVCESCPLDSTITYQAHPDLGDADDTRD
jgi:hypothetical protein